MDLAPLTQINIFTFFTNNVNLIRLDPNQANGCYFARVFMLLF